MCSFNLLSSPNRFSSLGLLNGCTYTKSLRN
jgi:hypothetical protein